MLIRPVGIQPAERANRPNPAGRRLVVDTQDLGGDRAGLAFGHGLYFLPAAAFHFVSVSKWSAHAG